MSDKPVTYELTIKEFETITGTTKLLVRKGKRLEVRIPSGVDNRNKVVLPNALEITDGKAGDILILIKVSPVEELNLQSGTTIDLIFRTCLHEIGGTENSDVHRYIERLSLVISRDNFFQAVIWAVWVSGMSRKAAAGFRRNNEEQFRNIDFMKFAALDTLQLEAFIEGLHRKPIPQRAKQKWQAIHYIATWLKKFSSDESFRDEVFQGKCKGSDLDETDALMRIVRHGEQPLSELMAGCSLFISRFSTTLLDAVLAGKPAIMVNFTGQPNPYPFPKRGAVAAAYTPQELRTKLHELLEDPQARAALSAARDDYIAYHLGPTDGHAAQRIAAALAECVEESS